LELKVKDQTKPRQEGPPRPVGDRDVRGAPLQRDAARTRQLLLEAARRRFARDGYAATTVRDITDDVGVNAALVSRYFGSKEDLFAASLEGAVQDLGRSADKVQGLPQMVEAISHHAVGITPEGVPGQVLLLLLRSSGDERAEQKRLAVLRSFASKIASVAGWTPNQPGAEEVLLRAQVVLSVAVGIAALRLSGLQPLGSATERELAGPLLDVATALLGQQHSLSGPKE
jgi:AcrR family transcriptional regulator